MGEGCWQEGADYLSPAVHSSRGGTQGASTQVSGQAALRFPTACPHQHPMTPRALILGGGTGCPENRGVHCLAGGPTVHICSSGRWAGPLQLPSQQKDELRKDHAALRAGTWSNSLPLHPLLSEDFREAVKGEGRGCSDGTVGVTPVAKVLTWGSAR